MAPKPAHNFSILLLQKNVCEKRVSITDRIRDFRRAHPGKTPLILVDLMHVDQIRFGHHHENRCRNVCGPNLEQLGAIEFVFQFLRDAGCDVVSFVDGPDNRDLHEAQFEAYRTCRKNERYERDIDLIDGLEREGGNYRRVLRDFGHIPTDRILFASIVAIAKRYGEIVYALRNSRSAEVGRYAFEHPATLAVLSKSGFLLLTAERAQFKIWYIPEVDIKEMRVAEFECRAVWQGMRLTTKKKRLLMAALLPGSFVGGHAVSSDVGKIYSFVQQLPANIGEAQYRGVVEELFSGTGTSWEQLKQACELYNVQNITRSEQTKQQGMTSFAYDILNVRTSIVTIMLNDYRYWTERHVDFHRLFVRFYGRLAGVVLKRAGSLEPTERRIRIKRSHEEEFVREMVKVEFPDFDVDGETASFDCLKFILGFEEVAAIEQFCNEETNRWKLLDFVTVQYMAKEGMISDKLADTIMKTVENHSGEKPELVEVLDMEVFHGTFMYVRWRYFVREALVNSGFPADWIDDMCRLDGARLQMLHQQRREGSSEV